MILKLAAQPPVFLKKKGIYGIAYKNPK